MSIIAGVCCNWALTFLTDRYPSPGILPSDNGVCWYVKLINTLSWNISVASDKRLGSVKIFWLLFCPRSRLTAQYTASKNSWDALKICNWSRRFWWAVENAVEGGRVKLVGWLEFNRTKDVVIDPSVSILLSVSFGYSATINDNWKLVYLEVEQFEETNRSYSHSPVSNWRIIDPPIYQYSLCPKTRWLTLDICKWHVVLFCFSKRICICIHITCSQFKTWLLTCNKNLKQSMTSLSSDIP